ncbi:MAG: ABC transporter substrate binding protein, partial [Pseudolabrys sp.]
MPAVYPFRIFPEVGGLLSYGPNFKVIFRRTAEYVDKILRGARPADLPVEAPTELEFVINLNNGFTPTANSCQRTDPIGELMSAFR